MVWGLGLARAKNLISNDNLYFFIIYQVPKKHCVVRKANWQKSMCGKKMREGQKAYGRSPMESSELRDGLFFMKFVMTTPIVI